MMVDLLKNIKNWNDFQSKLEELSTKERGDAFELVTKEYLLTDPVYRTKLKNVWLLTEVPQRLRKKLNLPDTDQGIDIVAETNGGEYWAIQCKYRSGTTANLTWREISTFTGLTFGVCKNFSYGLIAYSGARYTKVLKQSEHIGFLSNDIWTQLDGSFFAQFKTTKPKKLQAYKPRPHQKRAIANAKKYFAKKENVRGKLIMPCGAGKSLTGFWIAEALEAKTVVVAVPSLSLIQQTLPVWLREYAARNKTDKLRWLCVCSDQTVTNGTDSIEVHTQDLGYPCLTSPSEIEEWLKDTKSAPIRVIFTTYQSGEVFAKAARNAKFTADLAIMDEAHKTVGQKTKLFSHLLFDENLPVKKRVFMTATERRYAGKGDKIISMDDPSVYGDTFDLLTFRDALEQKPPILSDYKVITIVISEDEVQKLVTSNKYVLPDGSRWNKEVEAQMLASMIALRKVMQKYPIKHTVSFHSSIARARLFQDLNDTYTELTPKDTLDTYHVTGALSSAVRKQIINEFASAPRSLITNARCLTEGVDVPNIDCVLFTDPKQSTIDIVQAVGRALRPAKGKKYGYVIVPVIAKSADSEAFVESDAFKQIMTLLRSLASSDDRIIEHFKAINSGKKLKGGTIVIEIDEKVAASIDLENFAENIETRVWDKLAKLTWQPYDEAIKFVHELKLRNRTEWEQYVRGNRNDLPPLPRDIPRDVYSVYGKEFVEKGGMGAWLGTGFVASQKRNYQPYAEAVKFVHSLELDSKKAWVNYCRGRIRKYPPKPSNIPTNAEQVYRNKGWVSWSDWLGSSYLYTRNWRSFESARDFAQKLKLRSQDEWRRYCRNELPNLPRRPKDIPKEVQNVYKDLGWVSWGDWLGTNQVATFDRKYRSYDEAKKFVLKLKLKGQKDWEFYCKGRLAFVQKKPEDIPNAPHAVYKNNGWTKWSDWLGTTNKKGGWRSYDEAIKFIHGLKLKSNAEWEKYKKGHFKHLPTKPSDIPNYPRGVYKEFSEKGGMEGWLGTKPKRNSVTKWRPYHEAKLFVKTLGLTSGYQWDKYIKGEYLNLGVIPFDIPRYPKDVYEKTGDWESWSDWLGKK